MVQPPPPPSSQGKRAKRQPCAAARWATAEIGAAGIGATHPGDRHDKPLERDSRVRDTHKFLSMPGFGAFYEFVLPKNSKRRAETDGWQTLEQLNAATGALTTLDEFDRLMRLVGL